MSVRKSVTPVPEPSFQSVCGNRTLSVAARVNAGGKETSRAGLNPFDPIADWPSTAPVAWSALSRSVIGTRQALRSGDWPLPALRRNLEARVGAFGFT